MSARATDPPANAGPGLPGVSDRTLEHPWPFRYSVVDGMGLVRNMPPPAVAPLPAPAPVAVKPRAPTPPPGVVVHSIIHRRKTKASDVDAVPVLHWKRATGNL